MPKESLLFLPQRPCKQESPCSTSTLLPGVPLSLFSHISCIDFISFSLYFKTILSFSPLFRSIWISWGSIAFVTASFPRLSISARYVLLFSHSDHFLLSFFILLKIVIILFLLFLLLFSNNSRRAWIKMHARMCLPFLPQTKRTTIQYKVQPPSTDVSLPPSIPPSRSCHFPPTYVICSLIYLSQLFSKVHEHPDKLTQHWGG